MIPLAAPKEIPSYQASQWLKLPLLLSYDEMQALLEILPDPFIPLSGIRAPQELLLRKLDVLTLYNEYVNTQLPDRRLIFAITGNLQDMRAIQVEGGILHRIFRPVIEVQPYTLHYSVIADKFHEMTFSPHNFYWGLLFSYPQLYNNPVSKKVEKVTEADFPNTKIFKELQRFARSHTMPTPFMTGNKKVIVPAKIGKQLMDGKEWIALPQK
jgi:hypothetical protein